MSSTYDQHQWIWLLRLMLYLMSSFFLLLFINFQGLSCTCNSATTAHWVNVPIWFFCAAMVVDTLPLFDLLPVCRKAVYRLDILSAVLPLLDPDHSRTIGWQQFVNSSSLIHRCDTASTCSFSSTSTYILVTKCQTCRGADFGWTLVHHRFVSCIPRNGKLKF